MTDVKLPGDGRGLSAADFVRAFLAVAGIPASAVEVAAIADGYEARRMAADTLVDSDLGILR